MDVCVIAPAGSTRADQFEATGWSVHRIVPGQTLPGGISGVILFEETDVAVLPSRYLGLPVVVAKPGASSEAILAEMMEIGIPQPVPAELREPFLSTFITAVEVVFRGWLGSEVFERTSYFKTNHRLFGDYASIFAYTPPHRLESE